MESRIARLEEVAEPRKEWTLQFTLGRRPAPARWWPHSTTPLFDRRFRPWAKVTSGRSRRADRYHRTERAGKVDAAAAVARPACRMRDESAWAPAWRSGRSTRPAPNSPGPTASSTASSNGAHTVDRRRADPAREIRSARRPCGTARRRPLAGERTRRVCAAAGLRNQRAGTRRTDEPPRPARHRRQLERRWRYQGAVLLVTHDRRMLQNIRLDRSLVVDDGQVTRCERRGLKTCPRCGRIDRTTDGQFSPAATRAPGGSWGSPPGTPAAATWW